MKFANIFFYSSRHYFQGYQPTAKNGNIPDEGLYLYCGDPYGYGPIPVSMYIAVL